jgi:hypothetical protein
MNDIVKPRYSVAEMGPGYKELGHVYNVINSLEKNGVKAEFVLCGSQSDPFLGFGFTDNYHDTDFYIKSGDMDKIKHVLENCGYGIVEKHDDDKVWGYEVSRKVPAKDCFGKPKEGVMDEFFLDILSDNTIFETPVDPDCGQMLWEGDSVKVYVNSKKNRIAQMLVSKKYITGTNRHKLKKARYVFGFEKIKQIAHEYGIGKAGTHSDWNMKFLTTEDIKDKFEKDAEKQVKHCKSGYDELCGGCFKESIDILETNGGREYGKKVYDWYMNDGPFPDDPTIDGVST